MTTRREFIGMLGGALLATPLADRAFATMAKGRADALVVFPSTMLFDQRRRSGSRSRSRCCAAPTK